MMKKFHLCKATDLYDCGTATFGIAKGNIQSVLTLVISDPEGERGGGITTILFTQLPQYFVRYTGVCKYERVTSFVSL
jgi:hypothetical protein